MAAKLRELERWYLDENPPQEFSYSPAFVAAHGWDCDRTGVYLTAKQTGHRVFIQPGLRTKAIEQLNQAKAVKGEGLDGVTFVGPDGYQRMLLFDTRRIRRPAGPAKH